MDAAGRNHTIRRQWFRRSQLKCVPLCLRAAFAFLAAVLVSATLHAQIVATAPASTGADALQRFDIEGGAAYSHFNPGYAHRVAATNLLGWDGSADLWFAKNYGLEANSRGVYGSYTVPVNSVGITGTSNMSEHLFLFGPTFRMLQTQKYTAGMRVLVGGAYGSFNQGYASSGIQPTQIGIYNDQLAFAAVIGGWADYNLRPKFSIRFKADYQPTHYGNTVQNEFVGTVGIVYKIGSRSK
jgi:hypothetical protein